MKQVSEQQMHANTGPPIHWYPAWFARLPLAKWGWREMNLFGWPLVITAIGLVVSGGWWSVLAAVPLALLLLLVYFFRDPPRRIPTAPGSIVSPADGTVVEITELDYDEFIGGPAVRIGIFLSVLNVHINRSPMSARVLDLRYKPGEFISATRPESSLRNESMWIGMEESEAPCRRFTVRQISGMLARRIVCTLQPGLKVARGEKFGMIKLGSRTELTLPAGEVRVDVRLGDSVRAGSQIIAHWKTHQF
jgi:phosphatidylserine decarboxylase